MIKIILSLLVFTGGTAIAALNRQDAQKTLDEKGIVGLVHAANAAEGLYVMSYVPDPSNFFDRYFFSLVPSTAELRQALSGLRRNDKIRVRGLLNFRKTSQPHLLVNDVAVEQTFSPPDQPATVESTPQVSVVDEIERHDVVTAMVHAIPGDDLLVAEIRDKVVPIVVKQPQLLQGLGRGDILDLRLVVRGQPSTPTHGQLVFQRSETPPVLKIQESFASRNNQQMKIQGRLALFPKSPLINRDIWAVEEALPSGLYRYYTLVNFDQDGQITPEMDALSMKLRKLWDANKRHVVAGRNKLINNKINISADGRILITSGDQANAQIHLRASDIQRVF